MAYGTVKVDNITFDNGGADQNITVSGLYKGLTTEINVTGTVSGQRIEAVSGDVTNISGTNISYTTGVFTTSNVVSGVFASGTVSNPSITFTGDLNTGFYSPAVDQLAIATAGGERIRIQDDGDIGINTTSPSAKLHIEENASTPAVFIRQTGAGAALTVSGSTVFSGVVTATGVVTAPTFSGALEGNASTSTKLSSTRTFALTGNVTGTVDSDLTSGVSITTTLADSTVTAAKTNLTSLLNYVYYTTAGSGTYTPTAGTKRILVEVWGAGGGGGGVNGIANSGWWAKGGSGGGGGYCSKWIASGLDASYSYTVGAGGSGGAAGQNNGSAGGTSTFSGTGVSLTANAGSGGDGKSADSNGTLTYGANGGGASGGDLNIQGGKASGNTNYTRLDADSYSGAGWGFPVTQSVGPQGPGGGSAGSNGINPSEGGTGARVEGISTNYAGGNGAPGLIKITEYFI